jgi:hypothetical protein
MRSLRNQRGASSAIIFIDIILFFFAACAIWAIHGVRPRDDFKASSGEVQKIIKEEKAQGPLISLRIDAVNNDSAKATVVDESSKLSKTVEGGEIIVTVFTKDNKRFLAMQSTDNPKERITLEIK